MKIDTRELEAFVKKLEKLEREMPTLMTTCTNRVAGQLVSKVKKKTKYVTGTLRDGWRMEPTEMVEGRKYRAVVRNTTNYAHYVEFGHRTRDLKGFVKGRGWYTESMKEVADILPQILQAELDKKLKELVE